MANVILLGTRKGLLMFEYAGGYWRFRRECLTGSPIPYALHDPRTDTIWASVSHGHWGAKLQRSNDFGETWAEVPAPKYPEGEIAKRFDKDEPATLQYIWTIAPGPTNHPKRLYFGTEPGGLFVTHDDGATCELNMPLWRHESRPNHWFGGGRDQAAIHSILVDPTDDDHIYVAVSCAGVFETRDGGNTWAGRNNGLRADWLPDPTVPYGHDPHLLVACASNFKMMWQQNHGGIFRSTDGGANWQDVSEADGPAKFGFAIAVDAHNPDQAWVVPAESDGNRVAIGRALCVCRTDDGGKTWKPFRMGLPQGNCYDVVFRHALDQTGDRLAFGSTTGNVYVSIDRGETWQTLGQNLPPIYSVRFAAVS